MQEEKGNKRAAENNEEKEEEKRPKQQFDKDYTLEPYEGVGPEFMEMSESLFHLLSLRQQVHGLGHWMRPWCIYI